MNWIKILILYSNVAKKVNKYQLMKSKAYLPQAGMNSVFVLE